MKNSKQELYSLLPQHEDSIFDYAIRLFGNIRSLSRKLDQHDVRELLLNIGIDPDWSASRLDGESIAHLLTQRSSGGDSIEDCSKAILLLILNCGQLSSDVNSKEKNLQLEDGDKDTVNRKAAIAPMAEKRSSSVAVSDTDISMTEANLRLLMQGCYERAMKAACAWSFGELYPVLFSISGTLFLTLLTSNFHDALFLSSNAIKSIAWFICILAGILGIGAVAYHFWHKPTKLANERDGAIDELIGKVYEKAD